MKYHFPNSRTTKRQQAYDDITDRVLHFIIKIGEKTSAENLWLIMREKGETLSQSTFNNRLKILVEAGIIQKFSAGYNKFLYSATKQIDRK